MAHKKAKGENIKVYVDGEPIEGYCPGISWEEHIKDMPEFEMSFSMQQETTIKIKQKKDSIKIKIKL